MSRGVLIGWIVDGEGESIMAMYLVQLTHLEVRGGEEVIRESDKVSNTGLWSEDSSLRFIRSYESCGRWISAMSKTSGLWPVIAGKNVGELGAATM